MTKLIVLGFLLLGANCTDDGGGDDGIDPIRCGDFICNGFETSSSCPSDCVPPPPCSATTDTCTDETICVASQCVAAFPRVYRLTAIGVAVPTTRPSDGTSWDPLGGAPDLFLGQPDGTPLTAFVLNSFTASFAGPLDVSLTAAGETLAIGVFDDDAPAAPDGAFVCQYPLHGQQLRTRTFSCMGAIGALTATIEPR